MAENRAAAQALILKYIDKIFPGGINRRRYEEMFAVMNDIEFKQYMADLENGTKKLVAYVPNMGSVKVTIENNLKVAKELNHDFFQKLVIGARDNEPSYTTPIEYLVVRLPVRRQSQHLQKKRSIPEHNRTVDILTGQPTGSSKGAKISYSELQVLAGMDMDASLVELIKYRGGDRGGYNALNAMVSRYGSANLKGLDQYATGVESTKTLKTLLAAMHLRSTL